METKHIAALRAIVGEENCFDDTAHKIAYCYDATRCRYEPDAVVFARNEDDVSQILRYCN